MNTNEPTTPSAAPTPEAVEAAMRIFANTPWKPVEWSAVHPLLEQHREHKNNEPDYIAGRILAAEVEQLRAQLAAAQATLELYKAANSDVARIAAERDAAQAEARELREALQTAVHAEARDLREALHAITRRIPIMGSTGQYREGQLRALAECSDVARAALAKKEGQR